MDADIAVRPATPDDAAAIARLSVQLGYTATTDEIALRLSPLLADRDSHAVLVLTVDGTVAGWTHVLRVRHLEIPEHAEIAALVVDADHRNAGLGEHLVKAAVAWAQATALETLRVRSNTVRTDAHRFYTRLGFEPEKTQLMLRRPATTAPH